MAIIRIFLTWLMSALGQKRTLGRVRIMSALPPKADIPLLRHDAGATDVDARGLQRAVG
jgi:hypothetical protein